MLDFYATLQFIEPDGSFNKNTIVTYTTQRLCNYGLKNINQIQKCADIWVYPMEYFCPKDYKTNLLNITNNTRTIHHYDGSWLSESQKYELQLKSNLFFLPIKLRDLIAYFLTFYKYDGFCRAIYETYKLFKNRVNI